MAALVSQDADVSNGRQFAGSNEKAPARSSHSSALLETEPLPRGLPRKLLRQTRRILEIVNITPLLSPAAPISRRSWRWPTRLGLCAKKRK